MSDVDKMRLGRELDRRYKLTDDDRENIKRLYDDDEMSIRGIARMYPQVTRRTIQFILFPERLERVREQYKERGGWKQYYDKDKWRESMREHRKYKREVLINKSKENENG